MSVERQNPWLTTPRPVLVAVLGLATGSTIFNDIEGYDTSVSACQTAVLTYQSRWTARLHDYGYLSGFYSIL